MKKFTLLLALLTSTLAMADRIAIIGAMDSEIKILLSEMKEVKKEERATVVFYEGKLLNKDVVVFKSGIGKVNAAMSTTIAMEEYDVNKIIFTGVAGAINKNLNITDVVISDYLVQHDYDTTIFGSKKGAVPGSVDTKFFADKQLINIAKNSAQKVLGKNKVYIGTIATGDQFIADKKAVEALETDFGAWAVEMEGAAVAHVANLYKTPIVVIRSMSDKADGSAHMNYNDFVNIAADNSAKIVMNMLLEM
ncbi:5'-methylthioadenosine/adenosylhomocysteine nucleosidase [Cetobacterium sp.]|uniref:5'-methylthioadenosine/adenosylhomocysteine nucleosidase n=1 Tax=Cetobacterium sp. TaxID=2071632 RepID=UPI003F2B339A